MLNEQTRHNIGERVRSLRKENQLTIKQLAVGSDLSPNAISLIERGEVSPTVATLCRIAASLGVHVESFFQAICPYSSPVTVKRANSVAETSKTADPLAAVFGLSTNSATGSCRSMQAGKSVVCLSGQIEYELGGQCYLLSPGDSISFNGESLHSCRAVGANPATAVIVLSPEFELSTPQEKSQ